MPEIDYAQYPVLVVDDEPDILTSIRVAYEDDFQILCAPGGEEGLRILADREVAVIVADQRMPAMTGTEFLQRTMSLRPEAIRIILTGYSDVGVLAEAVNSSRIYQYVTKPWDHQDFGTKLRRGIESYRLERENARLLEELAAANERLAGENIYWRERDVREYSVAGIIGSSPRMRDLFAMIGRVADAPTTVLVQGETGTGKELVARALHDGSKRRDRLFVAVNCAALSENLLESELFGHRRGSFTGAISDRKGLFEIAHGGTLFLDEVSETTPGLQAKLLRVLQEGEITPVGENRPRKVDVRVVAATNRRLDEEVAAGRFRQDLLYRLRVVPLDVPPLRERREDIPDLVLHFVEKHAMRLGKRIAGVSGRVLDRLALHSFPGNVRELENEIERAVLLTDPGDEIRVPVLSEAVQGDPASDGAAEGSRSPRAQADSFARLEVQQALERHGGNRTRAAEDLGITYHGLLKRMRRLGMVE